MNRWTLSLICLGVLGLSIFPLGAEDTPPTVMLQKGERAFQRADIIGAMTWFRKAAEQGYAPAQFRLGQLLDNSGQNPDAVEWYRRAASQDYPDAQYGLAVMYANGKGIEQDKRQAFEWFARAAKLGHRAAIRVLVNAYEHGQLDLEVDPKQAVSWLRHGVARGDMWATKRLARAYRKGELGLPIDPQQAQTLEYRLPPLQRSQDTIR